MNEKHLSRQQNHPPSIAQSPYWVKPQRCFMNRCKAFMYKIIKMHATIRVCFHTLSHIDKEQVRLHWMVSEQDIFTISCSTCREDGL